MSTLKRTALFLGLVSAFGVVGASGEEALEISTNSGELMVVSTLAGPAKMKLVVSGPNGFREERFVEGDGVFWTAPAGAADGVYRFDVYSTGVNAVGDGAGLSASGKPLGGGSAPTSSYSSGTFEIDNGLIVTPRGEDDLSSLMIRKFNQVVGTIASLGTSQAQAQNLTAESFLPSVFFNDTDQATPNTWTLAAGEFGCAGGSSTTFEVEDASVGNTVISLCSQGEGSTVVPNSNSMVVDQLGDISFANGAIFMDRSTGNIGMGSTSPFQELEIVRSSFPFIRLEETGGATNAGIALSNATVAGDDKLLLLRPNGNVEFVNDTGGTALTWEHNSNFVGIGTTDPTYLFDVEVDGGGADGVPFSAVNVDGKVRFLLTASGQSWTFDNTPNADGGFFSVSKVGTGVNEFRVDADGDGFFLNRSFATQHINTSSRASKTDFAPVAVMSVLDKLADLPISQWRYKSEAEGEVHVGPVAEDFQSLFGLGDGKTISTVDASGIAFAALQGLHRLVQDKDAEIAEMKQANEDMAERLARLEAMVLKGETR